jgi:hypothetical protein
MQQSLSYKMLQWGPSIWEIPVQLFAQLLKKLEEINISGTSFTWWSFIIHSFQQELTIVGPCLSEKLLFLRHEVIQMP